MKIFYAVQATGNGHISRAMELLPHLQQYGEVDIFLSGNNSNLALDGPIKYRSKGISFYYNCNGSLDYYKSVRYVSPLRVMKEIKDLPVEKYDLIINDYEFITASACAKKKIPSINFGHQASFQSENVPRPQQRNRVGEWILQKYIQAPRYIGLHFKEYDDFIITPIIKTDILEAEPKDKGYITVYLPSYCQEQLIAIFSAFTHYRFEIFNFESQRIHTQGNITFMPVDKKLFNKSLINCSGIITGGGFETPAEALHLGKKIISIPIRGQYEQSCNAAALEELGVMTLITIDKNFSSHFEKWMNEYDLVKMDYSDSIQKSLERLFAEKPIYDFHHT